MTPYHDLRISAFTANSGADVTSLQITNKDAVQVLESPDRGNTLYRRETLFPGVIPTQIPRASLQRVLRDRIGKLDPQAVCLNGWSLAGSLEALGWCIDKRVPAILFSESTPHDFRRRWWKELPKRHVIRLCSSALVGGSMHMRYTTQLGMRPERTFFGYDVVDNRHFEEGAELARQEHQTIRDKFGLPAKYFLASCRFEEKKNVLRLLEAYASYRSMAGPSAWSLVILGDGKLKPPILALRRQLHLDEHVLLPGFRTYGELPAFYGLAGAFVHASTTEQWGLVVNEAMASSLPVLVSERCGCAPDLVHEGDNGFTFDPFDVHRLARLMGQLAGPDCDLDQMGFASLKLIQQWGPERFASGLQSAVRAAVQSSPPRAKFIDRLVLRGLTLKRER